MTKSRQATSTLFGLEFQVYAGIYLMLKTFGNFDNLKIEGEKEDIQIEKSNKSIQYAQAKTATKPFECDNNSARNKFVEAVDSFKDISKLNDNDELIYITNINGNPFGLDNGQFKDEYYLKFHDLTQNAKEKITTITNRKGVDAEKIIIVGFPFYGTDRENKIKAVKTRLREIIATVDDQLIAYTDEILNSWFSQFYSNGTIKSGVITKDNIATDLVYFELKRNDIPDRLAEEINIDLSTLIEAKESYEALINRKALSFYEYNIVINSYSSYKEQKPGATPFNYIADNYKSMIELFNLDNNTSISEEIKEACAKIIAYKIISRKNRLDSIYSSLGRCT